jgi:hypothetical protein
MNQTLPVYSGGEGADKVSLSYAHIFSSYISYKLSSYKLPSYLYSQWKLFINLLMPFILFPLFFRLLLILILLLTVLLKLLLPQSRSLSHRL